MNTNPSVNLEQFEAEMLEFKRRVAPVIAIVMPPEQWVALIAALQVAWRCPDLAADAKADLRCRIQRLMDMFPKTLAETQKVFARGWDQAGLGTNENA